MWFGFFFFWWTILWKTVWPLCCFTAKPDRPGWQFLFQICFPIWLCFICEILLCLCLGYGVKLLCLFFYHHACVSMSWSVHQLTRFLFLTPFTFPVVFITGEQKSRWCEILESQELQQRWGEKKLLVLRCLRQWKFYAGVSAYMQCLKLLCVYLTSFLGYL